MARRLPGINYQARVATDDLEFEQSSAAGRAGQDSEIVVDV